VSEDLHYAHQYKLYEALRLKYDEKKATMEAMKSFFSTQLQNQLPSGAPAVDAEVVKFHAKQKMGDEWVDEPQPPTANDVEEVPEGDHEIYGRDHVNGGLYGIELTCGVDYLIESLISTQMVKPIKKYLSRLHQFLGVRRGRGGNVIDYLNTSQTRKHELESDKTFDLKLPEALTAMLLLTFADVTEQEYLVIMGRLDSMGELDKISEKMMEDVLRNILGTRQNQRSDRAFMGEYSSDAYWVEEDQDWYSYDTYTEDSAGNDNQSSAGFGNYDDDYKNSVYQAAYSAVCLDNDPPLLPGEPRIVNENDGSRWEWDDAEHSYSLCDWDDDNHVFKVRRAKKGGKKTRRRFPRKGKQGQKAALLEVKSLCEAFWTNKGGMGKGKGGGSGQKSGKGWFGRYLTPEEFGQKMAAKRGKKGGSSGGYGKSKGYGKRDPHRAHQTGELVFCATTSEPPAGLNYNASTVHTALASNSSTEVINIVITQLCT
jgi:hypothetical protein